MSKVDILHRYRSIIFAGSCCVAIVTLVSVYWTGRSPALFDVHGVLVPGAITHRSSMYLRDYSASLGVLSKTLVVRRAYYDIRERDGHRNAVVFMLEMKTSVSSESFKGCQVGSKYSLKVHIRRSIQYSWAIERKHVTKDVAFVDCFDIDGMKDGDSAFLMVSQLELGSFQVKELMVKSQGNLIIPESRKDLSLSHPSVVTCVATIRMEEISPSEDGVLYQWLRYQKTIGVDHVHMIAEDTFVTMGGMDHPMIKSALKENFLSIDFWPRWFNKTEIYHSSQHLAYNDCLYRFQGVYDYVLFSDIDDFFVPRGESKSIKTYLNTWCSGKTASCNFQWHLFYPDSGWSPKSVGPDGNLTATLNCMTSKFTNNYKSAHQIQGVMDVGVHNALALLPDYNQTTVPLSKAYFAHLRKHRLAPGGC